MSEGKASESFAKCNYCSASTKTATVTPGLCSKPNVGIQEAIGCTPMEIVPNLAYDVPDNPCPRVYCVTNGDANINGGCCCSPVRAFVSVCLCLSVCVSACLSASLSVCLSACPSICLSFCQPDLNDRQIDRQTDKAFILSVYRKRTKPKGRMKANDVETRANIKIFACLAAVLYFVR